MMTVVNDDGTQRVQALGFEAHADYERLERYQLALAAHSGPWNPACNNTKLMALRSWSRDSVVLSA